MGKLSMLIHRRFSLLFTFIIFKSCHLSGHRVCVDVEEDLIIWQIQFNYSVRLSVRLGCVWLSTALQTQIFWGTYGYKCDRASQTGRQH